MVSKKAEQEQTDESVTIIRAYLQDHFQGFDINEKSDYPLAYKFTVTKLKPLTQYKLNVSWPRITDRNYPPPEIKRLLVLDDVAARMEASKGEYFSWGWVE